MDDFDFDLDNLPDIITAEKPLTVVVPDVSDSHIIPLCVLCYLIGLTALLLNPIITAFYFQKVESPVPFMYVCLSITDTLTGLSSLLTAVYFTFLLLERDAGTKPILLLIHCLGNLCLRVSAFLTTMLAVVRGINMANPFFKINCNLIRLAALLYPCLWLIVLVFDTKSMMVDYHVHDSPSSIPTSVLWQNTAGHSLAEAFLHLFPPEQHRTVIYLTIVSSVLPFLLPALICGVCCLHQSYALLASDRFGGGGRGRCSSSSGAYQRNTTLTITLLTSSFLVLNCSSLAAYLMIDPDHGNYKPDQYPLVFLTAFLLPYTGAVCNPVILLARGSKLREGVRRRVGATVSSKVASSHAL